MSMAITPEALDYAVMHAIAEIESAFAQILSGEYPQYNENCQRDIAQWLESIAVDRERQIELGGGPYSLVRISHETEIGTMHLGLVDLPDDTTLAQVRRWACWIHLSS